MLRFLKYLCLATPFFALTASADTSRLTLPEGLKIEVVAQADNARQLALSADGKVLFAGSRKVGRVYLLEDKDNNGSFESSTVLAEHLNMPSGVALRGSDLYVAEVHRILRFKNILPLNKTLPKAEVYFDQLPNKRHHGWKYLKVGPDGALYFNIGAPCNVCLSDSPFASIVRLDTQQKLSMIAQGVRNSVGLAWNPLTKNLWFTENGRDYLGDDQPSDELNTLSKPNQHFGYPYIHANNVEDPRFFAQREATDYQPPEYLLGAHVAPLGMTFYTPPKHTPALEGLNEHSLIIAEHGSWNRSNKVGYRLVKLQIEEGKVLDHQPFITGWLEGERHWGRPNDVIVDPNGHLLISDDYAGVIYRVSPSK